jgi:hypothetical protein
MRSPSCLCACESPLYQLLNAWTNIYETWYVYNGNWTHLNGVLHKSFPLVCVSACVSLLSLLGNGSVKCIPPIGTRQRHGKHVSAAMNSRCNRRIVRRVIFYAVRALSKERSEGLSVYTSDTGRQRIFAGGVVLMRSVSYQRQLGY